MCRRSHPLHEARGVEQLDDVAEREGQAGRRHQAQAREDRLAHAEVHGHVAGGQRAEQRPRGVGGGQQAGGVLAQPELVGQPGQQRRDRRVEHRVDEDDRADEQRQAPHGGRLVRRSDAHRPAHVAQGVLG